MQGSGQVCSGSRSCSPWPQHHSHRDSLPREEWEGSPEDGGNTVSPQVVALFSAEIPTENTGPCSERSKCVHFSENCDLESQFLSLLPHPADAGVKEFFSRVGEAARIAVRLFSSPIWHLGPFRKALLQKGWFGQSRQKTTQPFSHSKTSPISNPLPPKIMASLL